MLAILCNVGNAQTRPTYPQNENCPGLKNPSNFTFGGAWSGYTGGSGTKQGNLSTCTTPGYSALTQVPNASQLESQATSSTCYGNSSGSQNIDGQADCSKRFVIKGGNNTSQLGDPANGGQLTYLPPDTSYHTSIRLGNYCTGAEVEQLTYQMTINPNNAMVVIWYAMSLEYAGHPAGQNPEFSIIVEKQQKNSQGNPVFDANGNPVWELAGQSMCYIKEAPTQSQLSNLPAGMHNYNSQNIWKEWNKVMVNLYDLMYQNVQIKITAGDCSQHGHYAACYFAGECQPMKLSANGCAAGESNAVALIKAPKGAVSYAWYRSKTGKLTGDDRSNDNSYVLIQGETNDSLGCIVDHFIRTDNLDTVTQSTFMCKMTTVMNESYPIVSSIFTDVGNTKPTIHIDSALDCNAGITLTELSYTPYAPDDTNQVDPTATIWRYYTTNPPTDQSLFHTDTGAVSSCTFNSASNNYSVKVRTSAVDRTCWNEKTIPIRTVKSPIPRVMIDRNNRCKGDTVTLTDLTPQSGYHRWTFASPDTSYETQMPVTQMIVDTTTTVTLRTRSKDYYMADTTGDGIVERVYCYSDTTFTIFVQDYPKLTVSGDTIVCNGDQSNVTVTSENVNNCTYNWYQVMNGTTPVVENNDHLVTSISADRRYYVKVTSPFGCISWDSINLYLVNPDLRILGEKDKICTGDSTTLIAGRAATFTWTSNPPDPVLNNAVNDSVITVSPDVTTIYTVVGHGTNNCSTTPLSKKITVYPYPIMQVGLTPDYIDSENPSVQFADLSENGTSSLWNFGNGNTSTTRTVVFTFTDLSQDSILISLVTANAIGCTNDTSFYIPVGIFAVWFPNAFTPKLETNNTFKPFTANNLEDYELYIFDRCGNMVFSTTDIEEGWDGTYKGNDCKQGSYVYIAKYRRQGIERLMSQKGTLTLIR
jgi:gliding motility-associated-like protein